MATLAPIQTYPVGSTVRVAATLTDHTGAVLPSTDVQLLVQAPGSSASVLTAVAQEDGAQVGYIEVTLPGTWRYRFEAATAPKAAYEHQFQGLVRRVPAL